LQGSTEIIGRNRPHPSKLVICIYWSKVPIEIVSYILYWRKNVCTHWGHLTISAIYWSLTVTMSSVRDCYKLSPITRYAHE
jgi:hypothetical protein